jgi:quercetin dioxygenase-like cupin family protein
LKLAGADTGGSFSLVEMTSPPQSGMPPHRHREMDELLYVLDGTFEFILGDRVEQVGRRVAIFIPRGTLHGFRNIGPRSGRLLDLYSPGDYEAFLEEAGVPVTGNGSPVETNRSSRDPIPGLAPNRGMEVAVV